MKTYSFSIENITNSDAISISITGMSIVFTGLILISVYIWALPIILEFFDRLGTDKKTAQISDKKALDKPASEPKVDEFDSDANDIASVIGLVLNLEQERLAMAANEQITLSRNTGQRSIWGTAGKMRSMPRRRTHA